MKISKLAMAAKKRIEAEWLHGPSYDLATQAAEGLESAQMLQSPETAAELVELRARVAELEKRLHDAAMTRVWRNEDGKKFVFVEDIAPPLLGIERKPDAISQTFAPMAALREDDPFHLRHRYRLGRDLPEPGAP